MKFLSKLFLVLLMFTTVYAYSQTPLKQWSYTYNSGSNNNGMYDLKVDSAGNAYYACAKLGANLYPVPYLLKYSSSGSLQYSKVFEPASYPRGIRPFGGISLDGQNNIYMAGVCDSGIVMKAFVQKYNSNGDTLWTKYLGGTADTNYGVVWSSVLADNAGNVYAAGTRYVISPVFYSCLYIVKYSPSGELLWIKERRYEQGYLPEFYKSFLCFDNAGNIIWSGTYKPQLGGSDPDYNIAAAKLTPSGAELWYSTYNAPGNRQDIVYSLSADNTGNVYAAGLSEVYIAPHSIAELACIKFDGSTGAVTWTYKTRGDYNSTTYDNIAQAISINKNTNEIYLAGCIQNVATGEDAIIIKLNASTGSEIWRRASTGNPEDRHMASAIDNAGNLYTYAFSSEFTSYSTYTTKHNSTGDKLWEKRQTSAATQGSLYMALGSYNSIYQGGTTSGTPANIFFSKMIQVTSQSQSYCRSVNKPINDFQHTYDTVNVTGLPSSAVITAIEVKIDTILHSYAPDMQATLRSPQGLVDTLFKNPGSVFGGQNIINCVITDTASQQLNAAAQVPFTGYYRPYSPLSVYEGYEPNGSWVLSIYDNLNAETGTLKKYCLVVHYYDLATIGIQQVSNETPKDFMLGQNYPNPFNPTTNIKFSIPKSGIVTLKVFDILGRQVAELVNEYKTIGSYVADFNAAALSSGVYFYRLETEGLIETKKMLLVK